MENNILVLMSGGIDSTVLAHHYLKEGKKISGLFVDHDQPALGLEEKAVAEIALQLGIIVFQMNCRDFQYEGFFGPVRNAVLLSMAVNYAVTHKFDAVAIGICNGEYLDIRPEFIDRFNFMLDYCLKEPIYVLAPFAHWSKGRVVRYGIKIEAPLSLTTSCMSNPPCGRCQDCKLRRKFGIDKPLFSDKELEVAENIVKESAVGRGR